MSSLSVFAGSSNPDLAHEIYTHLGVELRRLQIDAFSNGNRPVHILESVK